MVENAKIEKFKCDILGDFQPLWKGSKIVENVPENQGTFFLGTWKGLFCRQKNNTCFACTKCNITEKNMKHPAMLARDRELQIRTREREICIEKMASSIFLLLKQPMIKLLKSFTSMKCMAWQRIYEVSFECSSWHSYNVWKKLKNVLFSKLRKIQNLFPQRNRNFKAFCLM